MKISIIAALASNNVIGKDNGLPWRLPADLQYFKRMTLDKPIIMGRKNYQSIGRPLPQRHNIIITRDPGFSAEGCTVVHSFDDALAAAGDASEVMIIGGAEIYKIALLRASAMYLTFIEAEVAGDTYFPEWQVDAWCEVGRENYSADARNSYSYSFVRYVRSEISNHG